MFLILRDLTGSPLVPVEFLSPRYSLPNWKRNLHGVLTEIAPRRLERLLTGLDYHAKDYIAKNHFSEKPQRDLILAQEDTYVFDIRRDIRDVVVSAYYHDRRVKGFRGSFPQYYRSLGRLRAAWVLRHNRLWAQPSPHVCQITYEDLKGKFGETVKRMAAVLNIRVDDRRIAAIREATAFERLRERRGDADNETAFYRKGVMGDWRTHFDDAMLADIERLQWRGTGPFGKLAGILRSVPFLPVSYVCGRLRDGVLMALDDQKSLHWTGDLRRGGGAGS